MNKKLTFIIIIIVALAGLTFYKYKYYDKKINKHYFSKIELESDKLDYTYSKEKDKDVYKENIIAEDLKSIDYSFYAENKSITGKIYIASDKLLYITDDNNKKTVRASNFKFRTMYIKDYEYDGIYVFLISEDNKLYYLELIDNDIKETVVEQIFMPYKVYNFVDIEFKLDKYYNSNSLFVLLEDGNIYDAASNIRYKEDIISMYDKFYVFSDKTMTNIYGYVLEDKEKNPYKIKYCFFTYEKNKLTNNETIIIITENDELLYIDDDGFVSVFNKKIKKIKFDAYFPYVESKLSITFDDNYKIDINAECNQYFCINKFKED